MSRERVLIVSTHPLFREGIIRLLGDQAEVMGAVASWEEANALPAERRPQVIIVDHDSAELQQADLTPLLWPDAEDLRVIYVTLAGDKMTVHERHQVAGAGEADLIRALKGERVEAPPQAVARPEAQPQRQLSQSSHQSQGRMERMEKGPQKRSYTKHLVIASVLVVIIAVVTGFALVSIPKFPKASTQAIVSDGLFNLELWIIGILFALVMVFMLYSLFVFRRRKGEDGDGDHFEGHTKLEITWTVIPLITVLIFGFLGASTLREVTAAQPNEMTVQVTAFSFGWQFDYPDLGVKQATKLYLPVNQPVLFKLQSKDNDVIHSFYVPEFRVKQDLVPGVPTQLRVTPNVAGKYQVRCNELCGTGHTYMLAEVNVVDQATFDAWVGEQKQAVTPEMMASRGEEVYKTAGCSACHNVTGDPGGVGPTWKGIYGHEVELADGSKATGDDAYIKNSVVNPNLQVVKGYNPGIMPQNYGTILSEEQITYLIEYIKTLQ